MKALYAHEVGNNEISEIVSSLCEEGKVTSNIKEFSSYLVNGVIENLLLIDDIIKKYAIEWEIDRIAVVDRNILRISIYEMLYSDDVPGAVAVNEAIEIAKNYGGEESAKFINGILGNVIRNLSTLKDTMQ